MIPVQQGESYTFYVRAADYYGNVMDTSAVVSFTVDTLKAPVYWTDIRYKDTAWKSGKAPLGYGNSTDSTVVAQVPTVYFRKSFTITESVNALGLLIKCHDGVVAYINDYEIGRVNMPDGTIDDDTRASSAIKSNKVFILDSEALAALTIGINVLAVEVHQAETNNPDLSFDARLFNQTNFFVDLGSSWLYYDNGSRPLDQTVGEIQSDVALNKTCLPKFFQLYQNFPNPYNPETRVQYSLSEAGQVKLEVFDITGRHVATLVDQKEEAGHHEVLFDGSNLTSGIYLYRLQVEDRIKVRRMMLLR